MMEELSFHILDLVQNSIRAGAKRIDVFIKDSTKDDEIIIRIKDNGKGMDKETLKRVEDPFYTTKGGKKVGLGLPLLKETALHCDGSFSIKSSVGKGTGVIARFKKSHIDLPPLGNISDTILSILTSAENFDVSFLIKTDKGEFKIDTKDIKKELGERVPICSPEVIRFLRNYLKEGFKKIY